MDLHTKRGDFQRALGGKSFYNGHKIVVEGLIGTANLCIGMVDTEVIRGSSHTGNRSGPLGQCAHGHEHTLNIRMTNNRNGPRRAFYRSTLNTVTRVRHGFLSSGLAHTDALHTHGKTRSVHHDEHVFQTAIFLTDQGANRPLTDLTFAVAKQQYCCGTAMDAKLVLERSAPDIIARTERTIRVDQEFWNNK